MCCRQCNFLSVAKHYISIPMGILNMCGRMNITMSSYIFLIWGNWVENCLCNVTLFILSTWPLSIKCSLHNLSKLQIVVSPMTCWGTHKENDASEINLFKEEPLKLRLEDRWRSHQLEEPSCPSRRRQRHELVFKAGWRVVRQRDERMR